MASSLSLPPRPRNGDDTSGSEISSAPPSEQLDLAGAELNEEPLEHESDDDIEEDVEKYDFDETESHVSIASTESDHGSEYNLSERPWLAQTDRPFRAQWEYMYANVTAHPIHGSWEQTEIYQQEKDKEMLRYLEDFPIHLWVIPQVEAKAAYMRLLERSRWRSLGVPVYGPRRIPEWIPNSTVILPAQQVPQHQIIRSMPSQHQPPPAQPPSPPLPPYQQPRDHLPQRAQEQRSVTNTSSLAGYPLGHQPIPSAPPMQQQMHQQMQQHSHMSQHHPQLMVYPQHMNHPQHLNHPQQMYHPQPQNAPGAGQGGPSGMTISQVRIYSSPYVSAPEPVAKRKRELKPPPPPPTPPPPPETPPYEPRMKPDEIRKKVTPKGRSIRKQAEADEFPWNRQNLDYDHEKTNATWDDSIYDQQTLEDMSAIRKENEPHITKIDNEQQEAQKAARLRKKLEKQAALAGNATEPDTPTEKAKKEKKTQSDGGDPYHSGNFAFADDNVSEAKAKAIGGWLAPDDVIEAFEDDKIDADTAAEIKICWNPGKKGMTQELKQARFSVRDTVRTRRQVDQRPILTQRAAECVVDYCPDMLWRGMLLRITSEAGLGNKDVRDRFCYNGCYCDKATITKRISAALGQKQTAPKAKGYSDGEEIWYQENVVDFTKYIDYFGKRTTHRTMLKIHIAGGVRKERGKASSGLKSSSPQPKRVKGSKSVSPSPAVVESDHDSDVLSEHETEAEEEK